MRGVLRKFCFIVGLFLACGIAYADHGAVAYVDGGAWGGWSVKSTRKDAEASALEGCREANPGRKCAVAYGVAISRADSPKKLGVNTSTKSKADAEKNALESCGAPDCKITWTKTTPGFFAMFASMSDGEVTDSYLQHGADTGSWAIEEGKRNCERSKNLSCELIAFGAIKGNFNAAKAPVASSPRAAPKSCRPNTPTIRCSSQCYNGGCTVSYENGCKMRVQVQPQFNGSTWVYPAPSC